MLVVKSAAEAGGDVKKWGARVQGPLTAAAQGPSQLYRPKLLSLGMELFRALDCSRRRSEALMELVRVTDSYNADVLRREEMC